MLSSAIGSIAPEEPPNGDVVSVEIVVRREMIAYLADSRHRGYRIDCLQQRKLECLSVLAVPATIGRDPTISLN